MTLTSATKKIRQGCRVENDCRRGWGNFRKCLSEGVTLEVRSKWRGTNHARTGERAFQVQETANAKAMRQQRARCLHETERRPLVLLNYHDSPRPSRTLHLCQMLPTLDSCWKWKQLPMPGSWPYPISPSSASFHVPLGLPTPLCSQLAPSLSPRSQRPPFGHKLLFDLELREDSPRWRSISDVVCPGAPPFPQASQIGQDQIGVGKHIFIHSFIYQ